MTAAERSAPPPAAATLPPPTADPRRAEQARQLGRLRRRTWLGTTLASVLLPWLAWSSGLSATWYARLEAVLPGWLATLVLIAALLLLYRLVLLPVSYALGYRLSRRYGLSTQTTGSWLVDWLKTTALSLALGTLVIGLFYACLALLGPWWWPAYAGLLSLGTALITYVMPYLLLPLFYRLRPLEPGPLTARIAALFARAGVQAPTVAAIDLSSRTVAANAAVIGLGSSRRVVLGDTLLDGFSLDEIETVVAHELGHHVHGDVVRGLALEIGALWLGLAAAALLLDPLFALLGWGDWRSPAAFPLLALLAELAGLVVMPLMNAWSRARERAADGYALALTGRADAFAAAMERLGSQNLVERQPPRWAEWLLATHPSVAERVAHARSVAHA